MKGSKSIFTGAATLAVLAALLTNASEAQADPCGMVPPPPPVALQANQNAIERVGLQKTYVAHHHGIETMVLRPGFTGHVEEFGMLIPFPSVPAIRKVDEKIFPQVAASIDPPEVVAYVQRRSRSGWGKRKSMAAPTASRDMADEAAGLEIRRDEVRVLKQEAVGMYEVAVLEAGSAKALERWMDQHEFMYPTGMDDVAEDYVDARWVFAAIKTRVGSEESVSPSAGQRRVDAGLPEGARFDGHVQAMGFRFESDRLVVPMRLSAFNPGPLHNVVYVLADEAREIEQMPDVRAAKVLSGRRLYRNVTEPLPLRVVNGTYAELTRSQKESVRSQRNPDPHVGVARDLYAADLYAMRTGKLSLDHEEIEKDLLNIGESLDLRGAEMDALHSDYLAKERKRITRRALPDLSNMEMTVIDAAFNRDIIAAHNLEFVPRKRRREHASTDYNARTFGPSPAQPVGVLYTGSLDAPARVDGFDVFDDFDEALGAVGFTALGLGLFGLFAWRRRRLAHGLAALAACGTLASCVPGSGAMEFDEAEELVEPNVSSDELVALGQKIVKLSEVGGDEADARLEMIHEDAEAPPLARTWAAAARIKIQPDMQGLVEVATLTQQFPATTRTWTMRLDAEGEGDVDSLALSVPPQLASLVYPRVSADALSDATFFASDAQTRQSAASYLAARGSEDPRGVARAVLAALDFRPNQTAVPWTGGPLYIPGIAWEPKHAVALVDNLMRWRLWAELHEDEESARQIDNNLASVGLMRTAGYGGPAGAGAKGWLVSWEAVVGRRGIRQILRQQGLEPHEWMDDEKG